MKWLNQPDKWNTQDGTITVTSDRNTDFWRKTHYGFFRDNGHFYYQQVIGDFTAEVKVTGDYRDLYDQSGLMVRLNETVWLKCGIELVERMQVSAVVTRDYSDWSIVPMPDNPAAIWLRVIRQGEAVEIHYSFDRKKYTMLRMAYLTSDETLDVGIMCASPKGKGFTTTFEQLKIQSWKN